MSLLCNALSVFVPFHFKSACLIIVVVVSQVHFGSATGYQQPQTSRNNEDYASVPANYMFKYAVQAGQYNNEFGHEEERNGKQTRGQYRVKLPDGRLQIVTYTADENGYKADVTYQPASGFGSGSTSNSDSYSAGTNQVNSGGYGQPQSQPQNQYQSQPQNHYQSQGQSQSYGTPTNSWQNGAGSNSGSFMMQRRKINGRTYSFETKY